MFHLAKTCPHCNTVQNPGAAKKLKLSSEEARSLLASTAPAEPRMKDVAASLVLPRGGGVDVALTVVALPVTFFTLVVLGYGVLQMMRSKRAVDLRGARMLAVPTSVAFVAVLLVEYSAPMTVWGALGISFTAWLVRDVMRARARVDPLH
jgi:hypothetical protein